jgi:hypothetical protein
MASSCLKIENKKENTLPSMIKMASRILFGPRIMASMKKSSVSEPVCLLEKEKPVKQIGYLESFCVEHTADAVCESKKIEKIVNN